TYGVPWEQVVVQAIAECERLDAKLLVVDTLGQFAGFKGDDENSSGAVLAAVKPLQVAASSGIAVLLIHHDRKSGGEVGDSGRGSSALTGAVDIVLSVRRPDGQGPETPVRVIRALSRFDETPPEMII